MNENEIKRIVKIRAKSLYNKFKQHYNVARLYEIRGFEQIIYEKITKDNLWKCKDKPLLNFVCTVAIMDRLRKHKGFRKGNDPLNIKLDDNLCNIIIFNENFFERLSFEKIVSELNSFDRFIILKLKEGYILEEIGSMLGISKAMVLVHKKRIINILKRMYKIDPFRKENNDKNKI